MSFIRGNTLYNERDYKAAIKEYKKSIEDEEDIQSSYYNISVCYMKLEDYDSAIKYILKAISLGRESKYFFNLGYCYMKKGDYGSSLFNFVMASKLDEEDEDAVVAIRIITEKIMSLKSSN